MDPHLQAQMGMQQQMGDPGMQQQMAAGMQPAMPAAGTMQVDPTLMALLQERQALAHLQPNIPHTIALLDQTINTMLSAGPQQPAAGGAGMLSLDPQQQMMQAGGYPGMPPPAPQSEQKAYDPTIDAVGAHAVQQIGNITGNAMGKSSGKGKGGNHRWIVPVENHPGFNLTGRIVGPKGSTLRGLQATYNVRLFVRGVGSERPGAPKRNFAGDAVENDVLHVNIEGGADGDVDGCVAALEALCAPVEDRSQDLIKQQQLASCAPTGGGGMPGMMGMGGGMLPVSGGMMGAMGGGKVCHDFQKGMCTRGDTCKFAHRLA